MSNFADRIIKSIRQKSSCVVVGLDPRVDALPEEFAIEDVHAPAEEVADAFLAFNKRIIEIVEPYCVAVKPQIAFYERYGWAGFRAYEETISSAKEAGLEVIGDIKRSDIGSTAEAYAHAHLEAIDADSVTVNPYLGVDGVEPFLRYCDKGKGIFVLVKTTNSSSGEIQDWPGDGSWVWSRVAELVGLWGESSIGTEGYSPVGAVVGATYPEIAAEIRCKLPRAIFLVPGYGAQGAAAEACANCFNEDGLGAVVNSSRGIIAAWRSEPWKSRFGEKKWGEAVRESARHMRDSLERARGERQRS